MTRNFNQSVGPTTFNSESMKDPIRLFRQDRRLRWHAQRRCPSHCRSGLAHCDAHLSPLGDGLSCSHSLPQDRRKKFVIRILGCPQAKCTEFAMGSCDGVVFRGENRRRVGLAHKELDTS